MKKLILFIFFGIICCYGYIAISAIFSLDKDKKDRITKINLLRDLATGKIPIDIPPTKGG